MTAELAGALRERVTIERRIDFRDAIAGRQPRWGYEGAAWVAVRPLLPAELVEAEVLSANPRWAVTMRKREGIGPDYRLVWRGRFLDVRGVKSDPAEPSHMVLTCDERR